MRIHSVSSIEDVRQAVAFAMRIFDLSDSHRGGFTSYYEQCFQEHPELLMIAEKDGVVHGIVLANAEGDHIKIGEIAVEKAYRREHLGSRMLALVEKNGRALGYRRFLLGATPDAFRFYQYNGYSPQLFLTVKNIVTHEQFEDYIRTKLKDYPLIWLHHDSNGSSAIVKVPSPDLECSQRIERELPTCGTQFLFFKDTE